MKTLTGNVEIIISDAVFQCRIYHPLAGTIREVSTAIMHEIETVLRMGKHGIDGFTVVVGYRGKTVTLSNKVSILLSDKQRSEIMKLVIPNDIILSELQYITINAIYRHHTESNTTYHAVVDSNRFEEFLAAAFSEPSGFDPSRYVSNIDLKPFVKVEIKWDEGHGECVHSGSLRSVNDLRGTLRALTEWR